MKFLNGKHLQGHALLPAFYQGQKSAPESLAGDHPAPVRIFSVKSILGLLYGPDCPSCTPSDPIFCQDRAEQPKVICTMLSSGLLFWEQVMAFQSLNPMDGHATSLIGLGTYGTFIETCRCSLIICLFSNKFLCYCGTHI